MVDSQLKIDKLEQENFDLKQKVFELMGQVKGLEIALDHIKSFNSSCVNNFQSNINAKSEPVKVKKPVKNQYDALIEFKAKQNKRAILKQKIISLVANGITLAELRFLYVDYNKYSSKATFYNYLKELEFENMIKIQRENSKNVVSIVDNYLKEEIINNN